MKKQWKNGIENTVSGTARADGTCANCILGTFFYSSLQNMIMQIFIKSEKR